jgi:hypothetical protein
MVTVCTKITHEELRKLFGKTIPPAVDQILQDATDDRTIDVVRSELRSLALQIEAADHV